MSENETNDVIHLNVIAVKISVWNNWLINKDVTKEQYDHLISLFNQGLMFSAWDYICSQIEENTYDNLNLDTEVFLDPTTDENGQTVEFLNHNDEIIWTNKPAVKVIPLSGIDFLQKASSHFLTEEYPNMHDDPKFDYWDFINDYRVENDHRSAKEIQECIELLAQDLEKMYKLGLSKTKN